MKRLQSVMCLTILAAIAMIISSCGNGGTPTVATTATTTTVAGRVTDMPSVGATVRMYSMKTGAQVGSDATTGADGSFTIDADFTQYDTDDVFYTVATGGQVNGKDAAFLKFKSILGSNSDLQTAGADGTINATEIPDLAVSNVTSAKVALVEKKRGITMAAGQNLSASVTNIIADESEQEKENMGLVLKVAGAIKALVDSPDTANATYGLTLDADNDLMDYIATTISVSNDVANVTLPAALETAGALLEDDILADEDLAGGLTGEAMEAVAAADIAGEWYGYSVNTWGDAEQMRGPELHNMIVAATGGSCTTGQLYLTLSDDGDTGSENVCADFDGKIVKFNLTHTESIGTFVDEIVGTLDGNNLDGTFTTKLNGKALAGGIFKFGMADPSTLAGTYTFTGEATTLYIPTGSTTDTAVGDSGTMLGSITVSGTTVQGTIVEESSTTEDILVGELDGPRVKARLTTMDKNGNPSNTIFMVFLLNDYEVTGLYMEFAGQVSEPSGTPTDAGKFKLSNVTKS